MKKNENNNYSREAFLEMEEELRKLRKEKDFSRAHRLAMGTLTLGVAHEIRNTLAVINSEMELIKNHPRDKEYLEGFCKKMLRYTDRIEGIVQKIADLARVEKRSTETPVEINQVIELALSHTEIKDNVTIRKEFGVLSKIMGIPEELEKAVFHIIDNSFHAMPEGGSLTIKTNELNGKAEVVFIDTGMGIEEDKLERIFDPFYSSRHVAAGLGLSIVYRIIKEHSGNIYVSSKIGKGTTFTLVFDVPIEKPV